jgi:hypothetical protein
MKTVRGLSISFVGLLAFEINELFLWCKMKEYQANYGVSSVGRLPAVQD